MTTRPDPTLFDRLRLARTPHVGPRTARLLEERCGPPHAIFSHDFDALRALEVPTRIARSLTNPSVLAAVKAELAHHEAAGNVLIGLDDPRFPLELAEIHDPPQVLSLRGREAEHLLTEPAPRVAIVGARRATPEGLEIAFQLAQELAAAGVVVVSGLARGVDTAAHEGALSVRGRTLAVLGSGLARVYPLRNLGLAERIQARGALISEFAPETEPRKHTFPQRNRIVTGLSQIVIVVQAGPRSGALLSADFALQQGRELCAVPGSIREPLSQGTNGLIRDGAHLITCARDVLDLVQGVAPEPEEGLEQEEDHEPDSLEASILKALGRGASCEQVAHELQQSPLEVARGLARLELAGRVRAGLSGLYVPS